MLLLAGGSSGVASMGRRKVELKEVENQVTISGRVHSTAVL